uniref:Uncharacterized protein n=1 Tax=Lepeophtheirus salmonis TaxID=72036 RepID=A0A0K2SUZ2_LEPSM
MTVSKLENRIFYWKEDGKLNETIYIHVDDLLSAGSSVFKEKIGKNNFKQKWKRLEILNILELMPEAKRMESFKWINLSIIRIWMPSV